MGLGWTLTVKAAVMPRVMVVINNTDTGTSSSIVKVIVSTRKSHSSGNGNHHKN